MGWIVVIVLGLVAVAAYDLTQRRHAILRNFPIIGHFRYWLEAIGPELRQYIVTSNNEERPFSRDQRSWVYASAKQQNNLFGFGTDNDLEQGSNTLIIKHAAFPWRPRSAQSGTHTTTGDPKDKLAMVPCAKVMGAWRGRKHAFRPRSIVHVSAMSYGSLSSAAVQAINRGCNIAGALHNTGEGGISPHHDQGGELIWQLGTGYFGARTPAGRLDIEELVKKCRRYSVRAIEIKLSQGAKPGKGGMLPGAKVTAEIARIRGIPEGEDCLSPAYHPEFSSCAELVDLIERIADATGLPVGIKSAVGQQQFWEELARHMAEHQRGPDYIAIDGGEGGTGAAPLVFSDKVALPFKVGFARVYRTFVAHNLHDKVIFVGSGRLGFPAETLLAFGLGCDIVAVAREAMLAIGCIQAQRCHSGHCPTGVATQNAWLVRGLDPTLKSARLANYLVTLRKEVLALTHACGVAHPSLVGLDHFEIVDASYGARPAAEVFGYTQGWSRVEAHTEDIEAWVEAGFPVQAPS